MSKELQREQSRLQDLDKNRKQARKLKEEKAELEHLVELGCDLSGIPLA